VTEEAWVLRADDFPFAVEDALRTAPRLVAHNATCGVEPSDFNFTSDSSLGPSRNTPYTLRVQNGTTAWRKTHNTDWTSIAPFA